MLRDLLILPTYFKSRHEIYEEFYKPCMINSCFYDRITGYFGSSIFLVINESLIPFIKNGGKIRIICSPILTPDDFDAIRNGYISKLNEKVASEVDGIIDELSKKYPSSTLLLSKMISAGILEIKLATFGNNPNALRLMHDKAGIFIDKYGDFVGFRGSFNETFKGLSEFGNSESFDAFPSWKNEDILTYANNIKEQFDSTWNNAEPKTQTFSFPNINSKFIEKFKTDKTNEELLDEVEIELKYKKSKWRAEDGPHARNPFPHQEKFLNNWEKNGRKGLLEMCTGAGKTFMALCAIRESIFDKKEIPLIIVPSKLLLRQWINELEKMFLGEVAILKIGDGHKLNTDKLKMYTNKDIDIPRCVVVLYQTASKEKFLDSVQWGEHIFLICDEVHNIGSERYRKIMSKEVGPRIGLSATPKRYFDAEGTQMILDFFVDIIEPKYGIKDAIFDEVLVKYFYDVKEIRLEPDEQEKWNKLTREINRKIALSKSIEDIKNVLGLEIMLFQRADIVKKARNKITYAEELLIEKFAEGQRWLVYLDDTEQLTSLLIKLKKVPQIRNHVFEYHTNYDGSLPDTLNHFILYGGIILAINCLDEGVDIPAVDHALILASSKNPRQYIQRRGRVLRTNKNKTFSYIYDCCVTPYNLEEDYLPNLSIIKGEISRALEFAQNADNSGIVKNKLEIIMNNNNIQIDEGGFEDNE